MYNTMYAAPSLVSNKSTAVSRSFVLKQFQANMPFVSQTNKKLTQQKMFVWLTKGMFAWNCLKTKLRDTAVDLLETREGAEYIVLYILV